MDDDFTSDTTTSLPLLERFGRHKRVLVAEDDDDLRFAVGSLLELAGFEVERVRNGIDLIVRLDQAIAPSESEKMPDAIVTDVRMPGCTGLQALNIMSDAVGDTPCFVVTAMRDPDVRDRAEHLGARYLLKPFDPDALVDQVATAVGHEWSSRAR